MNIVNDELWTINISSLFYKAVKKLMGIVIECAASASMKCHSLKVHECGIA